LLEALFFRVGLLAEPNPLIQLKRVPGRRFLLQRVKGSRLRSMEKRMGPDRLGPELPIASPESWTLRWDTVPYYYAIDAYYRSNDLR
jgi:hypothetical protein